LALKAVSGLLAACRDVLFVNGIVFCNKRGKVKYRLQNRSHVTAKKVYDEYIVK